MIHSGYPVMNPWSINVKVVLFWGGRRSLFQTSTKGSFCLRASQQIFTSSTSGKPQSSFLLRSIPMYDRVGMLEKRRLATEVWGGCPDVLEIGWSARVNNSSYLKSCWICVDVASFMANLLKTARLSATWKRPNLSNILLFTSRGLWFMILPARGTGGHGHAKFWGSGCEGGTSRLGQIMGNSSGNVIWVTYITKQIFHSRCFSIFFGRKISRSAGFACFKIRVTNFSDISYLQARAAIETRDHTALADLMDQNFNLRRTKARSLGRAMWGYMKLKDFNPLWRVLEPGRDEDFPGGNGRGNAKFLNGISVNGPKK